MSAMSASDTIRFRQRFKKEDIIQNSFPERWGWLVDEYAKGREERRAAIKFTEPEAFKCKVDLKPVPKTASGMIGWLSARPELRLELDCPDVPVAKPLPEMYFVTKNGNQLSDGLEYYGKF